MKIISLAVSLSYGGEIRKKKRGKRRRRKRKQHSKICWWEARRPSFFLGHGHFLARPRNEADPITWVISESGLTNLGL